MVRAVHDTDDDLAALDISIVAVTLNESQRPTAYTLRLFSQPRNTVNLTVSSTRLMSAPIITDGLGPCDTTDASEQCFQHIQHLRSSIRNNPSWYPCLTGDSTLEELQFYLYSSGFGSHCSVPCQIDSRRACTASSQFSWAGALEVSPLTLQFDGQNWDQPQTILVWARDDQVDLGDEYSFRLTHTTRSDDTAYHGIAELVTVTVRDDDTAGVNLSPVENSAAATEGGTNFSFQVTLLSQPLDAVQLRSRVQLADHSISTLARVNPEIIR